VQGLFLGEGEAAPRRAKAKKRLGLPTGKRKKGKE